MLHIWSFDPGETTGWCHLSVHDGAVGHFTYGETDHIGIGNMLFENPALKQVSKNNGIEPVIVCESYQQRPGKNTPWSLETIGLVRYFAAKHGIPLVMYQPSEHKALITNDTIRRAGLWVVGQEHARDATRLAIYYLIKERQIGTGWLLPEQNLALPPNES